MSLWSVAMLRRILVLMGVVLAAQYLATNAIAQVSPGPLSRAHKSLEGVRNCTNCHAGGDHDMDERCLECHAGIGRLIETGNGLHAREGRQECAHCHPDHAGEDFALVEWGEGGSKSFDHERAGWTLSGAHAEVDCTECHRTERRSAAIRLREPDQGAGLDWAGINPSCSNCHSDQHEGRLGSDCSSCHNTAKWLDVPDFDHSKTRYALTGRHRTLECLACHQPGLFGATAQADAKRHLAPIAHAQCASCHRDPHNDRFGPNCAKCHNTRDFRSVDTRSFDHSRTRYPLAGAHARAACEGCHGGKSTPEVKKPAFDRCDRCHGDAHAGQLADATPAADCAVCHEVRGFRPSTFSAADHARTDYSLVGKHVEVACERCHEREQDRSVYGSAGVDLRPKASLCSDCHADAHGGQFAAREGAPDCSACHDQDGFRPSTFDAVAHAAAGWPLEGAHARLECARCHGLERAGLPSLATRPDLGTAKVALALQESSCSDCHADLHAGRYAAQPEFAECDACHTTEAFRPSRVDADMHSRFRFDLEGGHRATPCFLCHAPFAEPSLLSTPLQTLLLSAPEGLSVELWNVPSSCESCHLRGVPR